MDLGLEGKVALVTAANRGLGRAVATELAREGARVLVSSRNEETLARTASEIGEETGAQVGYFPANVSEEKDVWDLVSHAADRFRSVNILINNTGGPPAGGFDDFGDEAWREAFDLILLSPIRMVHGVLPFMRDREGGRVVNIASSSVKQPIENLIPPTRSAPNWPVWPRASLSSSPRTAYSSTLWTPAVSLPSARPP